MPGPTLFEIARSLDNELKGNFRYPVKNVVAAGVTSLNGTTDAVAECDASAGSQSIELQNATLNAGMPFFIKKTDATANQVVVSCAVGGQLIDGAASFTLTTQNDFLIVFSNGVGYSIYSKLITSLTPGSNVYTISKIYKTDGVGALNPVPGTLINFDVVADGECFFAANGVFGGSTGLDSAYLAIYVDGVLLCNSQYFTINGSGGDRTGPITQSPNGSIFLAAGAHTVELVASQTNLSLQASAADPLTLTAIYPGSLSTPVTLTPEAARVRTSVSADINPAATISFDVVVDSEGDLFNAGSPTKMTAQLGGWYIFESQLLTDAGMDGSFRSLKIRKNGTTVIAFDQRDDFVHNATQRSLRVQSGPISMAAGDYVEVIAETDATDTGQDTVAVADYSVVFSGARLIPGSASQDVSARISLTVAQTIVDATPTLISFDTVIYDTTLFFTIGSPTKLTIPVNGKYDLSAFIEWAANATGQRSITILKNSATFPVRNRIETASAGTIRHEANARGIPCVAGDFFEVLVEQNSGGPLDVTSDGGEFSPVFYAKKVN